jgi:hypothetical protein
MPRTHPDSSPQDQGRKGCSACFDIGCTQPCRPVWFIGPGSEVELRQEVTHFLQRHPGMDLIDIDCELILNALYLAIEVRGNH